MHELAVMENVLEIVLARGRENGAKEIKRVNLVVGSLSGIIPKWAGLFFEMIAKDTPAQGAVLNFRVTPANIRCRVCGRDTEFTSEEMMFHCSHCGSGEISLTAGKEFHIESIEAIVEPPGQGSQSGPPQPQV